MYIISFTFSHILIINSTISYLFQLVNNISGIWSVDCLLPCWTWTHCLDPWLLGACCQPNKLMSCRLASRKLLYVAFASCCMPVCCLAVAALAGCNLVYVTFAELCCFLTSYICMLHCCLLPLLCWIALVHV
jgi:hypothetical protein